MLVDSLGCQVHLRQVRSQRHGREVRRALRSLPQHLQREGCCHREYVCYRQQYHHLLSLHHALSSPDLHLYVVLVCLSHGRLCSQPCLEADYYALR